MLMRHLLLTLLALFALHASAQQLVQRRVSSDYINMSYCSDNIQCSVALENGAPTKTAIAITRGMLGQYADAEIVGVRIGLANSAQNVSGWIIEGNDPSKSPAETSPTYSYKDRGWTDIIFRSPYTFSKSQGQNAPIIVGYTSTGDDQVGFDGEPEVYDNGNFMWTASRGWGSVAKICRNNGYGNACVQILLGGVALPTADMAIASVATRHAEQGMPFTLRGTVTNKVPTPVTSYVMTYSFNGGAPTEVRMVQNVNNGEPASFTIEAPGFTAVGPQDVTLSITSVNGEPDAEPADNTRIVSVESIEAGCFFPQVHVVEESTNTLCGFCPRGIVVMESLEARHPDRFIGIAVHSDVTSQSDPLFVPDYYNHLAFLIADPQTMTISEPKGIMNRDPELCGDPLYWDLYFDRHAEDLAEAKVRIGRISDVSDGHLDVELTTRFAHDHADHAYRLALVLVEDNVAGCVQSNYYAGGSYGTMAGWENESSYVRTALSHVARGIWDYDGLEGSLPIVIERKKDYPFVYTLDLAHTDYNIVENLSVVALLIDGATGKIVQADRLPVGMTVEGISPLRPSASTAILHNLSGQRLCNMMLPGVYIENGRKSLR